jgi:hypothetical protein
MTQREEFEAWAVSKNISIERDGFGGYASHWTEGALEGWQAAQAQPAQYTRGYLVALSDAEEAIDDECRERVVTASDCIEIIRNLGAAPSTKEQSNA